MSRLLLLASGSIVALLFSPICLTRVSPAEGAAFAEYAVAADHPEASEAGAAILLAGGNAADAAAATMLALGVVSPSSSGLGGGGFALYYRASDRSLTFLDFRERAPALATPDMFQAREGESADVTAARSRVGGLSVGVPGEPMGVGELVSRFGKLALNKVVEPAEKLARHGYAVSAHTQNIVGMMGPEFLKEPLAKELFAGEKRPRTVNAALADALSRLGKQGPSVFYTGSIAKEIVRAAKAHGGILSTADLKNYRVVERKPYRGQALGYEWASAPPPSAGGYTMIASLRMLERLLPDEAAWRSDLREHALIESWKGPYLDRQRYLGDPEFSDLPISALTSETREKERASRFHPALAIRPDAYALPLSNESSDAKAKEDHGTSHFCVVDAEGNIASVTTTVNLGFGSRLSVHGFWLNDEMDDFAGQVGSANAFGLVGGAPNVPAPGKRPLSSMTPTIVFQGDKPVLCVGGSGGSRIITAVEQVALRVLKDGMHPQAAISAPRVHHQGAPDKVFTRELSEETKRALKARGHVLEESSFLAHVQAIQIGEIGPERLRAGSEVQKGGAPRGQ